MEIKRWLFLAIDADDEEEYLSKEAFIGTYYEACTMADILADEWEQKTGNLILRIILESQGSPKRALEF